MDRELKTKTQTEKQVTVEEVNRLLEVGRLLFLVLILKKSKNFKICVLPEIN